MATMMSIDDVISRLSDLDTEDSSASSDAALMCEGTSCSSTEGELSQAVTAAMILMMTAAQMRK